MADLWKMYEINGQEEPYLDNPFLHVLNPRKKGKKRTMRRARRRVARRRTMMKAAVNPPRRRRRRRSARRAFAANPPARRRRRHSIKSRRHYRRNPPDILGFNLKDVAIAGAAVVLAPFMEKQLMGLLPTSMAGTKEGRWAVKVGAAVAVGFGAKKVLGPKYGNLALIALGANLISDAVHEFAPNLIPGAVGAYLPSNSGLGAYTQLQGGPLMRLAPFNGIDRGTLVPASSATDPFRSTW